MDNILQNLSKGHFFQCVFLWVLVQREKNHRLLQANRHSKQRKFKRGFLPFFKPHRPLKQQFKEPPSLFEHIYFTVQVFGYLEKCNSKFGA